MLFNSNVEETSLEIFYQTQDAREALTRELQRRRQPKYQDFPAHDLPFEEWFRKVFANPEYTDAAFDSMYSCLRETGEVLRDYWALPIELSLEERMALEPEDYEKYYARLLGWNNRIFLFDSPQLRAICLGLSPEEAFQEGIEDFKGRCLLTLTKAMDYAFGKTETPY